MCFVILRRFEFVDSFGDMILATAFNDEIDQFEPLLEEGKVYLISKAIVKISNTRFTSIKTDYCLSLSKYTQISPTEND